MPREYDVSVIMQYMRVFRVEKEYVANMQRLYRMGRVGFIDMLVTRVDMANQLAEWVQYNMDRAPGKVDSPPWEVLPLYLAALYAEFCDHPSYETGIAMVHAYLSVIQVS
jgi:hypothetical protein